MQQVAHHYITENYQRNFSDENGKIWVLDERDNIYHTNPINTFKEKHFYTVTFPIEGGPLIVEKTFAEVEGDFARVIKEKVNQRKPLDVEDKITLSLFMAALTNRTKSDREHVRQFLTKIVSEAKTRQIDQTQKSSPSPYISSGKGVSIEEIEEGLKDFDSWHTLTTANNMFELAPLIFGMNFTFLVAPKGKFYLCSDNPLIVRSPEREKKFGFNSFGARAGLAHQDIELTLPLTSDITLFGSWTIPEQGYIETTEKQFNSLQQRIVQSSKNIFTNNEADLREVLEKEQITSGNQQEQS